jgi:hypothetical protein
MGCFNYLEAPSTQKHKEGLKHFVISLYRLSFKELTGTYTHNKTIHCMKKIALATMRQNTYITSQFSKFYNEKMA